MRIGVVTTSYPRHPHDLAGNFVAGLNRYLRRQGHEVTVVAAGDAGRTVDPDGVTVHRVPSALFYGGGAPDALAGRWLGLRPAALLDAAGFSLALLRRVSAALAGAELLLSHWLLPCGLLAALCQGGRRHIAIAHSSDVHLLRRLRLTAAVRWLARRARLVYSAAALQVPGATGRVVPMGIDCQAFRGTEEERQAARQGLGLAAPGQGTPLVLSLGRLVPVKGLQVLLAALAGPAGGDEYQVWLAGDGPLAGALREQARALGVERRVRFLGPVHGDLRRRLLLAADALVLPSLPLADGRSEGAPTVLCEALAAGCPVVATRVGGVADTVGPCGVLAPPGDAAALAQALRAALDPAWQHQARLMAPRHAGRYDWSVIAPRILAA